MIVNDRVDGMLLNVSINGAPLRCETSADFSYTIEMLPATNPNQGRWRDFIPGVQTWSVSVNGHLLLRSLGADFKTLVASAKLGEKLFLRFGSLPGVTPKYAIEGWVLPSNLGLSAPSTDLASWAVTFQGCGAFETDWDEFGMILDNNPAPAEWPLIYDANE